MTKKNETSDIEALLFRPSKVSWGVQTAIIKLNPKNERIALFSIIGILISTIIWAYFSIQAVVVDASGEIIPIASPIPMMSTSSFTIKKISAKDNQLLKKDDLVLESTRHLAEIEKRTINAVFMELGVLLDKEKKSDCLDACLINLKQIADERLNFLDSIDQGSEFYRDLTELNKSLNDYVLQLKSMKQLPETLTSLINDIRIARNRIQEVERRKAQKILALEYEELQNNLINLQTKVREKELNIKSMLDNSRTNYDIALAKMNQSFKMYQKNAIVTAPTTGRIRFVNVKGVGQNVNAGEMLFMMTQSSSDLWLKFNIAEADLSKIKLGQEARVDLSSYPASEFGIQKATVVELLDKLPVESEQQKTPHFTGFAKFGLQSVKFKNKLYPLRSGMQGRVKIIVKHESVLTIFIKKIFSIKDEYLGSSE
jgi:multidrug efflux pump subunit AcrA (membrane-fusion protein)